MRSRIKDLKKCLKNNKTKLKSQKSFRSDVCNLFTETINMIALKTKDHKRIQLFDGATTYSYGY